MINLNAACTNNDIFEILLNEIKTNLLGDLFITLESVQTFWLSLTNVILHELLTNRVQVTLMDFVTFALSHRKLIKSNHSSNLKYNKQSKLGKSVETSKVRLLDIIINKKSIDRYQLNYQDGLHNLISPNSSTNFSIIEILNKHNKSFNYVFNEYANKIMKQMNILTIHLFLKKLFTIVFEKVYRNETVILNFPRMAKLIMKRDKYLIEIDPLLFDQIIAIDSKLMIHKLSDTNMNSIAAYYSQRHIIKNDLIYNTQIKHYVYLPAKHHTDDNLLAPVKVKSKFPSSNCLTITESVYSLIEPLKIVQHSLICNKNTLDSNTKGTVESSAKSTLDSNTKSTLDSNTKSTLDSNTKSTLDSNTKSTLDSNAKSTLDSNAKSTLDSNAKSTLDSNTKSTLDSNTKSTLDSNAKSTLDSNAKSTLDSNAKSTLDSNTKSTLDSNAKDICIVTRKKTFDELTAYLL